MQCGPIRIAEDIAILTVCVVRELGFELIELEIREKIVMKKSGFTLIELLIVVTIIAILAGAAIPYVQDYVDEARRSRCKNDLDEVRNSIALYELRRMTPYTQDNIASLIGPFLSKPVNDPWGAPYVVCNASSTIYSLGPDGVPGTGDEVNTNYRPRMAVSKVMWFDTNQDGLVTTTGFNPCDSILLYCTRPLKYASGAPINGTGLRISGQVADLGNVGRVISSYVASFPFGVAFVPGSDTLKILDGTTGNDLDDQSGISATQNARADVIKIIAP